MPQCRDWCGCTGIIGDYRRFRHFSRSVPGRKSSCKVQRPGAGAADLDQHHVVVDADHRAGSAGWPRADWLAQDDDVVLGDCVLDVMTKRAS
jgi:hypothetical protein